MPVAVVHLLEVVDVDHQHTDVGALVVGARLDVLLELAPGRRARERIGQRECEKIVRAGESAAANDEADDERDENGDQPADEQNATLGRLRRGPRNRRTDPKRHCERWIAAVRRVERAELDDRRQIVAR